MKRLAFAVFVALFVGLPTAEAQATKPSIHPSREACDAAVKAGNYSTYEARNFVLRGRNPVPGSVVDSVKIEQPMCYDLLTFTGYRWVSLAPGTWVLTCNGKICGLASCWNPGREFFFPYLATPAPTAIAVTTASVEATTRLSGRIDVYHHFEDTVHVKVSGEMAAIPAETYTLRGQGFWCFRSVPKFGACLLGATGVIFGGIKAYHALFPDKQEPPGVITLPPTLPPGVDTRPPGG